MLVRKPAYEGEELNELVNPSLGICAARNGSFWTYCPSPDSTFANYTQGKIATDEWVKRIAPAMPLTAGNNHTKAGGTCALCQGKVIHSNNWNSTNLPAGGTWWVVAWNATTKQVYSSLFSGGANVYATGSNITADCLGFAWRIA